MPHVTSSGIKIFTARPEPTHTVDFSQLQETVMKNVVYDGECFYTHPFAYLRWHVVTFQWLEMKADLASGRKPARRIVR
jgi:hypothetical protein